MTEAFVVPECCLLRAWQETS